MINKIQKWLANPKRNYRDGLAFFKRFASDKQKADFLQFFDSVKEDETVEQFDIRFTTLVNQIAFAQHRIKSNPELFIESKAEISSLQLSPLLKGSTPEAGGVVNIDQLPAELSAEHDRLKDIVPIMAKLHADMADEKMADDHRAAIRAELVKLDDERRAIWKKIDSAGVEVEKSELETAVETNMIALGAKTALRIGQLKSYITRNQDGLKKHIEAGNQKKADTSRENIAKYTKELEELQALLPSDGK